MPMCLHEEGAKRQKLARVPQARSIKFGNPLVPVCLGSHAWSCCKPVMGTSCITGIAPPGNELLLVTIMDFLLRGHYTQVHTHKHTHTHRPSGTKPVRLLSGRCVPFSAHRQHTWVTQTCVQKDWRLLSVCPRTLVHTNLFS